jgi:hypothetical protein
VSEEGWPRQLGGVVDVGCLHLRAAVRHHAVQEGYDATQDLRRQGTGTPGAMTVKRHPFFNGGVNWTLPLVHHGVVRVAAASTHGTGPRRQRAAPPGPRCREEEAVTLDIGSHRRRWLSTSRRPGSAGGVTTAGSDVFLLLKIDFCASSRTINGIIYFFNLNCISFSNPHHKEVNTTDIFLVVPAC